MKHLLKNSEEYNSNEKVSELSNITNTPNVTSTYVLPNEILTLKLLIYKSDSENIYSINEVRSFI
jgi:hypothetical protein